MAQVQALRTSVGSLPRVESRAGCCASQRASRLAPQLWRSARTGVPAQSPVALSATDKRSPVVEPLASFDDLDFVCDQPVCTPAIAQILRALSQDVRRLRYGMNLFARDVRYQDGIRTFTGNARYNRTLWAAETVQQPKASVKSMRIVDSARAQIDWVLVGTVAGIPIDISIETQTQHSLVTGKVQLHKEVWDMSRCSVPAKVAVIASRLVWAAKQAAMDAGEGLDKAGDTVSSAFASMEEDASNDITKDPTDPTKFFQAEGNKNADLWQISTALAAVYLIYTAWTEVEKLG